MKKILVISLVILLSFCLLNAKNQSKYYAVKSGHVEYEISGNTTGTKSIWFDDYGMKTFTEKKAKTTIKVFGFEKTTEEHTLEIRDNDIFYNINLNTKEGSKTNLNNFSAEQRKEYEQMSEKEKEEYQQEILDNLGGEKLGNEKILGKNCKIITVLGAKSWNYKGLVLKSEVNLLGVTANEIAISIDENISVPSSKFKIPEGISIEDNFAGEQLYSQMMSDEISEESAEGVSNDDFSEVEMKYSFDKFKTQMNKTKFTGFNLSRVEQSEDGYRAIFMKTMLNSKIVMLIPTEDDVEVPEEENLEITKFGTKTAYFGKDSENGGMTLTNFMVHYKKYNAFLSLIIMGDKTEDEMRKDFKKIKF